MKVFDVSAESTVGPCYGSCWPFCLDASAGDEPRFDTYTVEMVRQT